MRKIIAIALKDVKVRFSSPIEWLFFLILPVVFTVVLAGGTGGSGDSRVHLLVVDQAGSTLSAQLISALSNSEAVRPDVQALAAAESQFSKR
jgi:ABC-2 type transport system permease protein